MSPLTFWDRLRHFLGAIAFFPVRIAFRIIWLWAKLGNRNAQDVYRAMWLMNLDLPRIPSLTADMDMDDAPTWPPTLGDVGMSSRDFL